MRAKEYLQQAYRLNQRINSDLREVGELRQIANSISSPQTQQDRVQTSHTNSAPFTNALMRIWEMENIIDSEIDRFVAMKNEIRRVIDDVKNEKQRMLLRYRYIHFDSWDEIADEMNYSLRWVHTLHRKALSSVDTILERRGMT